MTTTPPTRRLRNSFLKSNLSLMGPRYGNPPAVKDTYPESFCHEDFVSCLLTSCSEDIPAEFLTSLIIEEWENLYME